MNGISAPIPQPNIPFVSADGLLTRQGYYFLLSLFQRTGGAVAPINLATIQKQINSLFVEEAMNGEGAANPSVGLSLADVMSDDVPRVSLAPALLVAWVGDVEPRAALNPFLASLLVADAT